MIVRHGAGPGLVEPRVVVGDQARLLQPVGLPDELDGGELLEQLPADGGAEDGAAREDDLQLGQVVDVELAGLGQHPHLGRAEVY